MVHAGNSSGVNIMKETFSIRNLISKKRNGQQLNAEEIQYFIDNVVSSQVQGSQLGAMLMAICLQGMNGEETTCLTGSMMRSGNILSWPSEWKGLVVDKHSTGGVGDKISLPLAPALAACGLKVPMISGRGLGFTGGTLDKLESIPGFNIKQTAEEMQTILEDVGCCIVGQTESLVPADRILYATRDVSATVDSIPLISSSIVSKKAAESLDALVLDVKVGSAAFMQTEREAKELAQSMVSASNGLGVKTVAVLTKMDHPIGNAIGNAVEVAEAIQCLQGNGPAPLTTLVCLLGGHLLSCAGKSATPEEGSAVIEEHLSSGSALQAFCAMLQAQGVDEADALSLCDPNKDVFQTLKPSDYTTDIKAKKTGNIHGIDAKECALISSDLGAGRQKAGEPVDHAVGLQLSVAVGDKIQKGQGWIKVYHNSSLQQDHIDRLQSALIINDTVADADSGKLLIDVISSQ